MDNERVTPIINLHPNVIDGEELQELFKTVFEQMALYVSRTYGPFGGNTAYQDCGRILTTKDGWSVEQGIIYSNSMIANIVRKMIIDVSTAINSRAGDGTTTGLIAANEINNLMIEFKNDNHVHTKFLASTIQYCVQKICDELNASATKITDENMEDIIYKVASVSLDWDLEFARFIRDIYKNTSNPVIRVQDSGTEHSFVEYRDGYDLAAKLLSEFKVNSLGEKKYTMENPAILVFTYTVNGGMFEALLNAATMIKIKLGRELVVMAPNFEKDFRDNYNALCIHAAKARQELPSLVMVKYFTEYTIEREMLIDFSFLTGGVVISKDYNDGMEIINEFLSITKQPEPDRNNFVEVKSNVKGASPRVNEAAYQDAVKKYKETLVNCGGEFIEKISDFLGICDKLVVDDKLLVASGFGDIECGDAIKDRMNVISGEINKAMKDMSAKGIFTDEIKLKRIRLGKLRLKMGIIHVGGFGESQLKSKRDALDDAINACSNAFMEGVVLGGGIAIPTAINKLLDRFDNEEWSPENEDQMDNDLVHDILEIIQTGFIATWITMLGNRYPDGIVDDIDPTEFPGMEKLMEEDKEYLGSILEKAIMKSCFGGDKPTLSVIVDYCIQNGKPWNLITKKLDDGIIHPVRVETEVVKGCLNLVLNTTTINQLLYAGFDGSEQELKDMREVKE